MTISQATDRLSGLSYLLSHGIRFLQQRGLAPEVARAALQGVGIANVDAQQVELGSLIPGLNAHQDSPPERLFSAPVQNRTRESLSAVRDRGCPPPQWRLFAVGGPWSSGSIVFLGVR